MRKNKTKSDIFLKIILIICLLLIVPIVIVLMSSFFKDRFTSLDDYEHSYILKPGFYEVGVHLPAGDYVIQIEEEKEAEFNIYSAEDSFIYFKTKYYVYDNENSEKAIIKRPYGSLGISGVGGRVPIKKKVKTVALKDGQLLNIEPMTSFIFYSNDNEITDYNSFEITESNISVMSGTSTAGKDFPAGVYDIFYEPKEAEQVRTIKCRIKDIDASYLTNGYSFDCNGTNGTQMVAHGIPFTPGSDIIVSSSEEVILVPTKQIGETFNSLTWEAN